MDHIYKFVIKECTRDHDEVFKTVVKECNTLEEAENYLENLSSGSYNLWYDIEIETKLGT